MSCAPVPTDQIIWEPQLPHTQFRRTSSEQATIVAVSMTNSVLVRPRTNSAITRGARISIGLANNRGLVAVRSVEPASDATMSEYGVQFLWLDPRMQAFFDEAVSTEAPLDFEWR